MSRPLRSQRGIFALVAMASFAAAVRADPIITEFMASNAKALADVDGDYSDWIELYNPDAAPVSLDGWYLTDSASSKDKWKFPAITLPAGGYLVVFASNKNRRDPAKQLHTNFTLDAGGEYLALVKPDGATAVSEFAPTYPPQYTDISYGVTQPTVAGEAVKTGYFRTSTPGVRNGGANTLMPTGLVTYSRASGPFVGSVALTLAGAAAGEHIRYTTAVPSPAGAVAAEPTANSPEYTGPLTLNSSVVLRATVFSADNTQRGFSTTAHYVRLGSTGTNRLDTFSSQLPLMVLDTHGTGDLKKDGVDRRAWIYSWDRPAAGGTTLTATPTVGSPVATHVRGQSSSDFPKKSYSLSLDDGAGNSNSVAWFGLDKSSSWDLIGPWKYDETFFHNAFIYTLSNRIGRWAPRTQLVELFFNSDGTDLDYADYNGVYLLTDKVEVDSKRLNITPISSGDTGTHSITGGYFIKIDLYDPKVDFNFQTKRGFPGEPSAVAIATPTLADMPKAQQSYIQGYIQSFEDALYADNDASFAVRTYPNYIDRASWIDFHILQTFSENVDGLIRSTYMSKDRDARIVAGPLWDFDRALGGGDVRTQRADVWNGLDGAMDFWNFGWWAVLARDPEFMQAWIDRWQSLRTNEFSTVNLLSLVDSLSAQIGPVAGARDIVRWASPENPTRFANGWQGEVDNMRTWVAARAAWIDSQFVAPPVIVSAAGSLVLTPAAGTQVIYTTDGSDPRVLDGAISAKALTSATPVTMADTVNLQARSYAATVDPAKLPGSRWSGRIAGPKAGNSPIARLTNLSILTSVTSTARLFTVGTVIGGRGTGGPKPLLVRAAGPSLTPLGVPGALSDPKLELFSGQASIDSNDDWKGDSSLVAAFARVGAFAYASPSSKDSAIYNSAMTAGNYTVQVTGSGTTTGTVIAELYDSTASADFDNTTPRLINVSVLKQINAGEILTAGFVIGGTASKTVLVRAVGPTLGDAPFNVPGAMADPRIELFSGTTSINSNDNWGGGATLSAAFSAVGAFALPAGSKDAALLVTLQPGPYTAQVTGVGGTAGMALVEVYEVP